MGQRKDYLKYLLCNSDTVIDDRFVSVLQLFPEQWTHLGGLLDTNTFQLQISWDLADGARIRNHHVDKRTYTDNLSTDLDRSN